MRSARQMSGSSVLFRRLALVILNLANCDMFAVIVTQNQKSTLQFSQVLISRVMLQLALELHTL
ncbi:unnamed protein product [Brassica oleracea var. botrytis]|uniref:(rape) hypothetical protein n=1 Tax=Brassica napus TaxID=3708 RepID=A0A816RDE1_BRANA|nr:unnamed protein product [Brassica napus]